MVQFKFAFLNKFKIFSIPTKEFYLTPKSIIFYICVFPKYNIPNNYNLTPKQLFISLKDLCFTKVLNLFLFPF